MNEKLSVYEFGEQLLDTNDLDPVYVLLYDSGMCKYKSKIRKWLLAYWCFYHIGTASWIVDQDDYWKAMKTAAGSKDYHRSSERRHFRGANATKSVAHLSSQGIDRLFKPLCIESQSIESVMKHVQTWVGFGPWIAFKVADMLERLGLCDVKFDTGSMFLFDSPRQGAELMREKYGMDKGVVGDHVGEWAVSAILARLGPRPAPPRGERAINVQEAETILCKWKSYMGGHYRLGEDIEAVQNAFSTYSTSSTLERLKHAARWGES